MFLLLKILDDRLGTVMDSQFSVNPLEVIADRPVADPEAMGNFFIEVTSRQVFEDLKFPTGEKIEV